MSERTNDADKCVKKSRKGRSATATICGASPFLTIPKLGKDALAAQKPSNNEQEWLNIATLCVSLLDEDIQVDADATVQQIVSIALANWASKHCADVQVLDRFDIIAAVDDELFGLESRGDENDSPNHWAIAIEAGQDFPYIVVDEKLLELEKEFCGLGRTAIHMAEQASFKTFTVFSAMVAKDIASYIYWQGEDNDEDVIQILEDEGMELEEMFLPSQLVGAFPSFFFKGDVLTEQALQSIAASSIDSMASEVARIILSIMDLINDGAELPGLQDYSNDSAYFSCILGISADNNPLRRVIDDHFECANSGSDYYTGYYGIAKIPFEMESFLKWRETMEKGFALYSNLDHLIRLIKS